MTINVPHCFYCVAEALDNRYNAVRAMKVIIGALKRRPPTPPASPPNPAHR